MDVFSLLKFWRTTASSPDPQVTKEFDLSVDEEESFFDLVFTRSADEHNLNNKRRVLPLDSPNTKTHQSPQMLQSPLRMLKLGFQNKHNSKPEKEKTQTSRVEVEEVKIGALLKRDNSLRHQLMNEKILERDHVSSKRFSKEVVNKYLNLMKVSKRGEKSRLSDSSVTPLSSPASSVFSPRKDDKKSGGRTVFGEVKKHLGRKSDDSVLQRDGIQGAILHCKRSFNSPSQDYFLLRSGSAPVNDQARVSIEQNRSSI